MTLSPDSTEQENLPQFDYSVCEQEPIRQPGMIQAHGCLFATDEKGLITHISENFNWRFKIPSRQFLGKPLTTLQAALQNSNLEFPHTPPQAPSKVSVQGLAGGQPVLLSTHQIAGARIYEIEFADNPGIPILQGSGADVLQSFALPSSENLFDAARVAAEAVVRATGYNRVMVYRFHPDWSGEVIAEWREPLLIPYLGLRYPATDIPEQARQLYRENLLRVISNVNSIAARLLILDGAPPLNMSHCTLRAVSPYHLEYLQNMGVAATLTASILVNGELWGLIACHHSTPALPTWQNREAAGQIALRFGQWLEGALARRAENHRQKLLEDAELLRRTLGTTSAKGIIRRIFFGVERLTALFHCDAAALVVGRELASVGHAPPPEWLRVLAGAVLREAGDNPAVFWERLPDQFKKIRDIGQWPQDVCGVAGIVVARKPEPVVVLLFRREILREIHWGGDPTRPVEVDERQRLSPRKSFALYRQIVKGQSEPWTDENKERLRELASLLAERCKEPFFLESIKEALSSLADLDFYLTSEGIQIADSFMQGMALLASGSGNGASRVLTANAPFCETFALDPLRLQGVSVDELLQNLSARVLEKNPDHTVLEVWSPHHGHRLLLMRRKNFLACEGPDSGTILELFDFQDITGDQRLREAMRVARDQALHAWELKSAILANMSHELRTPLTAILGYAELMKNGLFGPLGAPQYQKAAEDIHKAGQHLLQLIEDLLDLARLESRSATFQRRRINLVELVSQMAEQYRPQAKKKSIQFITSFHSEPVYYYADPVRLKQALGNLLSNALKFTPEGGEIRLTLEHHKHLGVSLEVWNSGPGLLPEQLKHIFDRFYQADSTDLRKAQGMGLGLPIARGIVELHGGRLEAESTPGQGAKFRITLPDLSGLRFDSMGHPEPAQPATLQSGTA